jgi:hypothetical protein
MPGKIVRRHSYTTVLCDVSDPTTREVVNKGVHAVVLVPVL